MGVEWKSLTKDTHLEKTQPPKKGEGGGGGGGSSNLFLALRVTNVVSSRSGGNPRNK